MSFYRVFLLSICFSTFFPLYAEAKDKLYVLNYDLFAYRDGQNIRVNKIDQLAIKKRIGDLIESNTADTSEPWFKYEKEKHGESLEERWNRIKAGSYFYLDYIDEKRLPKSKKKYFKASDVIVEIHENEKHGFFGDVMAMDATSGEIKAYQVDNKKHISLYCFENTQPYLPEHYQSLPAKYDTREYHDSGVSCNRYEDEFLRKKAEKKKKKAEKWRKLREKKLGIKPKKEPEE